MALSAKLQFRQSQALVMTPQLMQSIKLLQLSHAELTAFIEREIEKNPLLALDEGTGGGTIEEAGSPAELQTGDTAAEPLDEKLSAGIADKEAIEAELDTSLENVFDTDGPSARGPGDGWKQGSGIAHAGDSDGFERNHTAKPGLREHLQSQLPLAVRSSADLLIAAEIINSLDDDGYCRRPLDEIAEALGADLNRVEDALRQVQTLDPTGIGARDLAECMELQLREKDRLDPAMALFVANLELVARRDFASLARICRVDMNDIADMVAELRALDPRPAGRFGDDLAPPVIADVIISPRADGGWAVELNAETLPRVLVDRDYYAEVAGRCDNAADKTFMTDCLQNANWLTRSLDQRAQTILKVSAEIVKQQDMFLAFGIEHLRPLNLKSVADAISMHESTVSRVTTNKYMMTPRGLFELKYFFTTAISSTGGEALHSAETVRHRIRQMIEAERADAVLSDDTIVEMLKEGGIDIARRTVAKYREGMNIPSSVQRRREMRASIRQHAV